MDSWKFGASLVRTIVKSVIIIIRALQDVRGSLSLSCTNVKATRSIRQVGNKNENEAFDKSTKPT